MKYICKFLSCTKTPPAGFVFLKILYLEIKAIIVLEDPQPNIAFYKVLQFKKPLGLEILITSLPIHDPGVPHKPARHILYKVCIDLSTAPLALI